MALAPETRRRILGLVLLLAAGAMLVVGLTVLAPRLRGVNYLFYWLGCMGLTFLAALTALLDLWATRRRIRQAQQELISQTVDEFSHARQQAKNAKARAKTSGLSKPTADASIAPVSDRKTPLP